MSVLGEFGVQRSVQQRWKDGGASFQHEAPAASANSECKLQLGSGRQYNKNHTKLEWNALLLTFDAHGILRTHAKECMCDDRPASNDNSVLRLCVAAHWNHIPLLSYPL
jgi:hypothetical protein